MKKINLAVVICLFSASCTHIDQVRYGDPGFAPAYPESPSRMNITMKPKPSGSLYNSQKTVSLFDTVHAKKVGDILTIMLEEQTQGIYESDTDTSKVTTTTIANPTIFGKNFKMPSKKPGFIFKGKEGNLSLSSDSEFEGESSSEQKNQLTGSISVTVTEVLSNGNLIIRGEKWMNINTGREYIRLKGIVRMADVTPDNRVSSRKIADAQITYSGAGQNQNANKMGWITKFFTSALWLL